MSAWADACRRCICLALVFLIFVSSAVPSDGESVTIARNGNKIDFRVSNELVTAHHIDPKYAKPFFWPLNAPGCVPLTRGWPMEKSRPGENADHPHQKSAWFGHGEVSLTKGRAMDFWAEAPGHGTIICSDADVKLENGKSCLVTKGQWKSADGKPLLDELRKMNVCRVNAAYLLIVRIELTANYGAVTFGDTKEGTFGLRVRDELSVKGGSGKEPIKGTGVISIADGKTGEAECWGRQSNWCDYSGTIDGKPYGITIFDDPTNKYRACWHVRDYGLMAANPFGRSKSKFPAMKDRDDAVKLQKGETLSLRYGLLMHTGDAKTGKVAEYFEMFRK